MQRQRSSILSVLLGASAIGFVTGIASIAVSGDGRARMSADAKRIAVAAGIARARPPEPGDMWPGCNDARAAGTAPIYAGEPGYRKDMDGDSDGVACEPIP